MTGRFERNQRGAGTAQRSRAVLIIKGDDAIGIAEVKTLTDQRHTEGLILTLNEDMSGFGHAITVVISPERHSVGADPDGLHAAHGFLSRALHQGFGLCDHFAGFGHQHIAIRQNLDPARMIEAGGKRIDRQARRARGDVSVFPTLGDRQFQGHDALLLGFRNIRR